MYKNVAEPKCTMLLAQTSFDRLNQSIDIVTERAANLFYNGEYKTSIIILNESVLISVSIRFAFILIRYFFIYRILKNDPYHCPALIILIGCYIELKEHSSKCLDCKWLQLH